MITLLIIPPVILLMACAYAMGFYDGYRWGKFKKPPFSK